MIPGLLILFLSILVMLRSFSKTRFFFQMIKKGLINPSHEDLQRINAILKDKKNHRFFSIIFKEILFLQIKIFLKRASKKEKFINRVNFIFKIINRYPFDREKIRKRMGRVINRYDLFLQKKIYSYQSQKPMPVMEFLKILSKIRKNDKNLMNVSFKAAQDALMILVGRPLIKNEAVEFILDRRLIKKLDGLWGNDEQKLFMNNLVEIKFAA